MVVVTSSLLQPFQSFHHLHPIKPSKTQSSLPTLPSNLSITSLRPPRATVSRPIFATPNDAVFLLSEANPTTNSDEIVSAVNDNGDGVSVVISVLLSIAFVGLSVLTLGVIYIGVTDFLQKREKEKFEKEEAEKAKRSGKKKRVRPRVGPKGFGQKIDNDNDF
ncbi:hypothetical protein M8C21_025194 [Ambrosia artemisiifolia]|uniref:Transmembrane protein n=1 Tax=Ambrosia artemisiifolia TaxID=4212 RepID=A0AAD5BNJ9_AMBAR|nr:hypothetical protein M8C21_025194 [Ambrosia artemisiifolia]